MNRRFRILFLTVGILVALVPAAVLAADGDNDNDLLLRINGPVTVGPDETYDNVVVISDNVVIEGTVTGTLVIVEVLLTTSRRVRTGREPAGAAR